MHKFGKVILCYLLATVPVVAASAAGLAFQLPWASAVSTILLLVLLLPLAVTSYLRARLGAGPDSRISRSVNRWLDGLQKQAESDPEGFLRKGNRAVILSWLYYWTLVALTLGMCFLRGAAGYGSGDLILSTAICGVFLLAGLVQILLPVQQSEEPEYILSESEYPAFYAAAREAAQAMGMQRPLKLSLDGSTGVSAIGETVFVSLGLNDTLLLTRQEMGQVLLHEMAHIRNADTDRSFRYRRQAERWAGIEHQQLIWTSIYLALPRFALDTWFQVHHLLTSRHAEVLADRAILEHGDPQAFVNGLAKYAMFRIYCNTNRPEVHATFAPESWYSEILSQDIRCFRQTLVREEAHWRRLLSLELPARVDSHPIFRQRAQAMGIADYRVDGAETDAGWLADVQRLTEYETRLCQEDEELQKVYTSHHEAYLQREKAMAEYRQAPAPLTDWDDSALFNAAIAFYVLDNDTAMAIIGELLRRNPDNAYALRLKGSILLDQEDEAGAEYLFRAAENANFVREVMDMVAKYALLHGDQELLDRYRGEGFELAMESLDRFDGYSSLGLQDRAVENDLPADKLRELLDFMTSREPQILREILSVKKLLPKDRHCYQFYLVFRPDTDPSDRETVCDEIFRMLDMEQEEYSLNLPDEKQVKLLRKKVPGCSLYRA